MDIGEKNIFTQSQAKGVSVLTSSLKTKEMSKA